MPDVATASVPWVFNDFCAVPRAVPPLSIDNDRPNSEPIISIAPSGFGLEEQTTAETENTVSCAISDIDWAASEQEAQFIGVAYVDSLQHKEFTLARPLVLQLERSGDHIVASTSGLTSFSYGETEEEAIHKYLRGLVEEMESLAEREAALGEDLKRELNLIRSLVVERP